MKRWHFPTECVLHQPGSPRPAEYIAEWRCSNILGVLSRAWLGSWGQEPSMGQGNLPRARAHPCLPVTSNPVCPGVCVPPLPPPSLSRCQAEHWDGQNSPVAPGHPNTAWGPQAASPRGWSQAAAPFVVPEVPGMCLSSKTKGWCAPAAPAEPGGCAPQRHLGREFWHSCAGCLCCPELLLRAGEKQLQPPARVIRPPLSLLCPPWGRAASDWGIPHARQGDSRDEVLGAAGQATGSSPPAWS